jgi:hypothetical protein
MPTLKQLSSGTINVYAADHPPPHFHVRGKDGRELKLAIPSLVPLGGNVNPALRKEAEEWARKNMATVQAEWKRLNP